MFRSSLLHAALGVALSVFAVDAASAQVNPASGTGCVDKTYPTTSRHARVGEEFLASCLAVPADMVGAQSFVIVGFATQAPVRIPDMYVCGGMTCEFNTTLAALWPNQIVFPIPYLPTYVGLEFRLQCGYFIQAEMCVKASGAIDVKVQSGDIREG